MGEKNSYRSRSSLSLDKIDEYRPVHRTTSEISLVSALSKDNSNEKKKEKKNRRSQSSTVLSSLANSHASSSALSSMGGGMGEKNSYRSRSSLSLDKIDEHRPVHRTTSEVSLASALSKDNSSEKKKEKKDKKKSKIDSKENRLKKVCSDENSRSSKSSRKKSSKSKSKVTNDEGIPRETPAVSRRSFTDVSTVSTLATDGSTQEVVHHHHHHHHHHQLEQPPSTSRRSQSQSRSRSSSFRCSVTGEIVPIPIPPPKYQHSKNREDFNATEFLSDTDRYSNTSESTTLSIDINDELRRIQQYDSESETESRSNLRSATNNNNNTQPRKSCLTKLRCKRLLCVCVILVIALPLLCVFDVINTDDIPFLGDLFGDLIDSGGDLYGDLIDSGVLISMIPEDILSTIPDDCRGNNDTEFEMAVNCGLTNIKRCARLLSLLPELGSIVHSSPSEYETCDDINEPLCLFTEACDTCSSDFEALVTCIVLSEGLFNQNTTTDFIDSCSLGCGVDGVDVFDGNTTSSNDRIIDNMLDILMNEG